jgi:hypothetical protein
MGEQRLQAAGALWPAYWYGLLGSMAAAADTREPSLWAAGILGTACQVWDPAGHLGSAAGTGEPSLQVVRALGPACQHRLLGAQYSSCCQHRGTKPTVTHGAAGALGPAYTGAPVSLAF